MKILDQYTIGKSTTTPSEDAVVVTDFYAAVIDGATPKTSYRYPDGETPGQRAARLLTQAIAELRPDADSLSAIRFLSQCLHQEGIERANRPTASVVLYSKTRREVWWVGDCQFATLGQETELQAFSGAKLIDLQLSDWRRSILVSGLSRGLYSAADVQTHDHGRQIIQPFITRQVRYQNLDSEHPLAYGVLDGEPVPTRFVCCRSIGPEVQQLILATDGYPQLLPTLYQTEAHLQAMLRQDPLCIGPLLGTKCVKLGNLSYDDRTYLRIEI